MNTSNSSNSTDETVPVGYQVALATMYTIVLIGGIIGIALMINHLKSNVRSVTTMAVINLIAVHILFLLTVPFRIYFYVTLRWDMSIDFCKVVSGMIHAHMYITFVFYVIILVIRYLSFFRRMDRMEFHRNLHALLASIIVWVVALVVTIPVFAIRYGASEDTGEDTCFNFGGELENNAVAALNYVVIAVVLLIAALLTCCQIWILVLVLRKFKKTCRQHQEFWAQIKSLTFVLVMLVCFIPYHLFRIHYVSNFSSLQNENEVFLAVTAFSCLDMLTFLGRNTYIPCNVRCC